MMTIVNDSLITWQCLMFSTITAVLSRDFSNDAVVEWGVTESILKEFYKEKITFRQTQREK